MTAAADDIQLAVEQQRGDITFLVSLLHFKYQYPAFVFTADGTVNFIIREDGNLGGINFHGFRKFFTAGIHFHSHAVEDISFLVLVDHVKKARVGYKIHVEGFLGHEIQFD